MEETTGTNESTSKAKAKTVAAKAQEVELQTEKKPSFVYLGPSLKTLPLRQGATYVGGIPKQFQEIYDTNADVRFLFVNLMDSVEVRLALRDPGSEHTAVFNQIKASGV